MVVTKADRENPEWMKEAFVRARKARDVLPEILALRCNRLVEPARSGEPQAVEGTRDPYL